MSRTREILHGVDLRFPRAALRLWLGKAAAENPPLPLSSWGRNKGYAGSVTIGGVELREVNESSLLRNITYVSHQSYLFKGYGAG